PSARVVELFLVRRHPRLLCEKLVLLAKVAERGFYYKEPYRQEKRPRSGHLEHSRARALPGAVRALRRSRPGGARPAARGVPGGAVRGRRDAAERGRRPRPPPLRDPRRIDGARPRRRGGRRPRAGRDVRRALAPLRPCPGLHRAGTRAVDVPPRASRAGARALRAPGGRRAPRAEAPPPPRPDRS